MQQHIAASRPRIQLPQGVRTWHRVLVGVCAALCLVGSGVADGAIASLGGVRPLLIVLLVVQLFVLLLFLNVVVSGAYLDGTVVVIQRLIGRRRCDLARALAVRLEQRALGLRMSAHDGRRWTHVWLRLSTYRGLAATDPLLALADAILAGPPRPEPAGREAWVVAQQLRQIAMSRIAPGRPARPVEPPRVYRDGPC